MRDPDLERRERRLRLIAPPAALIVAALAMRSDGLRSLVRVLDSMWLHELGHTLSGWLCGYAALPGPWRTAIPDERSTVFALVLAAALAGGAFYAWRREWRRLAIAAAGLLLVQLCLTLAVKPYRAQALVLFFGDGGAMVLGALLVGLFFVGPESRIHETKLRWGFLGLGAPGFMDPFTTWWRARRDFGVIPFGEIDGVGDSDPTRLVDELGWTVDAMVSRYVTLGVVCLIVLALLAAVRARPVGSSSSS